MVVRYSKIVTNFSFLWEANDTWQKIAVIRERILKTKIEKIATFFDSRSFFFMMAVYYKRRIIPAVWHV